MIADVTQTLRKPATPDALERAARAMAGVHRVVALTGAGSSAVMGLAAQLRGDGVN